MNVMNEASMCVRCHDLCLLVTLLMENGKRDSKKRLDIEM